MPQASSLAAELQEQFSIEAELIPGKQGIFDVKLNGELIYSKHDTGRFPNHDEVTSVIREKAPS